MTTTPSGSGKSLNSPALFQPQPQQNPESFSRSRSGGQPTPSYTSPRNNQAARKQHKSHKRPSRIQPDSDYEMDERRAISNATNRRGQTSITHLLNLTAPAPFSHQRRYGNNLSQPSRRYPTWGLGSGYHAADKIKYVHANYRFVVNPRADYTQQARDADTHVDWSNILQVLASKESQFTSCPICLGEPVAPRMAKCGHIFCLHCIIRYMQSASIDDESGAYKRPRYKKCPICDDSIYISDVRPVKFYAGQESPLPRPGDDVILRLMMRHSNSTLALPKEGGAEVLNSGEDIPWYFAANVLDYAHIMKGNGDYMQEQYEDEVKALLALEMEDEVMYGEDNEWTQKAVRNIQAAMRDVQDLGAETSTHEVKQSSNRAKGPICDYFFYTCLPHVYLSPLDIRILKAKFGDFSLFPSTLLPRAEHISTGHAVDDVLRKKFKYLAHLPSGCLVSFIECDWTDIIPADVLVKFKPELDKRRKRNHEKEAQEERERQQAEMMESAEMMNTRRNASYFGDDYVMTDPVINMDDFLPLVSSVEREVVPSTSTTTTGHRTVWGTTVAASAQLTFDPEQHTEGPVNDGWLREDELLDAAEVALQVEALDVGDGPEGRRGSGQTKKKKKQKITLMSTSGRRMG